jgi:hypothetical protein
MRENVLLAVWSCAPMRNRYTERLAAATVVPTSCAQDRRSLLRSYEHEESIHVSRLWSSLCPSITETTHCRSAFRPRSRREINTATSSYYFQMYAIVAFFRVRSAAPAQFLPFLASRYEGVIEAHKSVRKSHFPLVSTKAT